MLLCSSDLSAQKTDSSKTWLIVLANLDQYYLVIDKDFRDAVLINRGDSLRVEPGNRHITVVWQTINDMSFTVYVDSGSTTISRKTYHSNTLNPSSSYEAIITQTNLQVVTDPNSTIYIDGKEAGVQYARALVNSGRHLLHITHPEHGDLKKHIEVTTKNVTNIARFNKNPSTLPLAAKFLPGAEYIAAKRYGRAAVSLVAIGVLGANLIRQNNNYAKRNDEYNEWVNLYQNAETSRDAITYRNSAKRVQNDLDDISTNFNRTLLITAGVYVLSTLDAFRKPREGYKGKANFPYGAAIGITPGINNMEVYPELSIKYRFK